MKKNYIVLAILVALIGYKLWYKSPQEKAEKVVKDWMKHSYGDSYETIDISYLDTLNYSRKTIEEIEFFKKEIEAAPVLIRHSQKQLDSYREIYEENKTASYDWINNSRLKGIVELEEKIKVYKKMYAEAMYRHHSLKNSKQFLGYSVLHTYKAKGQKYNVFFLLDKDLTHVTDTMHYNYTSLRYLSAIFKNKFS
ncbi:hypothetical protein [Dysgonomonas reticulitermitis]